MNVRCFIAVDLTVQVKGALRELIEVLKRHGGDIKWVRSENLHLTLKFLGGTPPELLPKISESIAVLTSSYRPFSIKVAGVGVFPGRKNPRVVWVGIHDSETLGTVKESIENAMISYGYEKEDREFRPHLTIGRVRSQRGMISTMNALNAYEGKDFGTVLIDRIKLMKSELKPSGPEYTCLYDLPLNEG
jgi:RNA 2',3'-cyclic 3'-phosphodiesterase